ncbi:MAG: hypothetical protein U1C33_02580, partial [Candidatus Cloacimonadaceae bacterium]|nr:hypothetical protein [Candidatus Cloacimonadaceae bacterium]
MIYTKEKLEPRRLYYYPDDFDATDRAKLNEAFDELADRVIQTPRDLMGLLYQASELMSTVYRVHNELYKAMLTDTTDTVAREQFNSFYSEISTFAHERNIAILNKYYAHPLRKELNQDYFKQHNLFCDSLFGSHSLVNNDLRREETKIVADYRAHVNQLSFEFDGRTHLFKDSTHL